MRRFGLLSLLVHGTLLATMLWLQRPPAPAQDSDTKGAIELMLVEQPTVLPTPSAPEPVPVPPLPPDPPIPQPPPAVADAVSLPPPPPPPTPSPPKNIEPPPTQRATQAPKISIAGTNSETFAVATGPLVIPASVDSKFPNRQPVYPPEAARRAEQGAVTLLIRVSATGVPARIDVMQSSGYPLLDGAARDAVASWHFLPAVKDGQPVPFEMPMRVVFHLD